MNWILKRTRFGKKTTLGDLLYGGQFFCYTLEDLVRPVGAPKVPGETAIPAGRYRMKITWSPKFNKSMIEILNVPGFTGIRIHAGNSDRDTAGCPLVGFGISERTDGESILLRSTAAAYIITELVGEAERRGEEVWIEVI